MALSYTDPPQSWAQSNWTEGTGSVSGFSANGSTDENTRLYAEDPWGRRNIIWRCTPNGASNGGDGGWNSSTFAIDNTYMYRFSVWMRRTVKGTDGRFYFGTRNYNSSVSLIDINYVTGTTYTNNPYFQYGDGETTNGDIPDEEWVLLIGHVWPYGTSLPTISTTHPQSGMWRMDGTEWTSTELVRDLAWTVDSARTVHRSYLYYCGSNTDAVQDFIFPRVDKCDGTEPELQALLRHGRSFLLGNIILQ
jgi:hypothetical protein